MNIRSFTALSLALGCLFFGFSKPPKDKGAKAQGDCHVAIFQQSKVHFTDAYKDAKPDAQGVYHLAAGRLLLKKINLPVYERNASANLKITLRSAGDRWDKSGSCFLVPKQQAFDLLRHASGEAHMPRFAAFDSLAGIMHSPEGFKPMLELMRFMTPFGVGHYNDKMKGRRPVYIPKWEDRVVWEQDVTDRLPELEGEVWVGIWIDTWTGEGYEVSAELMFKESEVAQDLKKQRRVLPLANTVYYLGPQSIPNFFHKKDLEVPFTLPKGAKNVRLHYVTTGHGGHSGGDEFVKKENILKVDGEVVHRFIPWRDDCASFRRFNPSTGVWLIPDTASYIASKGKYETKPIEERLASSDLSRSNWCPGSQVPAVVVDLPQLKGGQHTLAVSIPEAQPVDGDKLNHWLVSAYVTWEE